MLRIHLVEVLTRRLVRQEQLCRRGRSHATRPFARALEGRASQHPNSSVKRHGPVSQCWRKCGHRFQSPQSRGLNPKPLCRADARCCVIDLAGVGLIDESGMFVGDRIVNVSAACCCEQLYDRQRAKRMCMLCIRSYPVASVSQPAPYQSPPNKSHPSNAPDTGDPDTSPHYAQAW